MSRRSTPISVAGAIFLVVVVAIYLASSQHETTNTTASASPSAVAGGSWYQLYFTNPIYPDDPKNHHGGLDDKLVALIDTSHKTLDVADYDFDLMNVAQAMARAKQRGVQVRMVTDTDTLTNKDDAIQAAFKVLKTADIPIVDDKREPIMHDKYTVVDGEWVETGSWNYTDGDTYHLNNWMGIFHSKDLATNYTADFEQMFVQHQFSSAKKQVPKTSLSIEGDAVQNCFSPQGSCANLIVSTIKSRAQKSLYFLAFSFTDDNIGNAMIDKTKAGVTLSGVFETTGSQTPYSEYGKMKKAGLDVHTDGNPWVMHDKVIIIDERTVVAGSFNFSSNADKDNDENLLIFDDPTIARSFKAEFDKILAEAKNPPGKKVPTTRE